MAHVATGSVVRQLGTLFEGGSMAGFSDRQLLERYTAGGDDPAGEAAFAALVGRHGPMVLGVCRQLLGDAQHAEDTFQAVFLVLAQKARSIRDPDLLGNWLYGVAIRSARCARQQIGRRRRREEVDAMRGPGAGSSGPAEPMAPPADWPAIDREQAEALHGEVDRLPKAFRLPVVLCYFEGLTLDEAARRLRCPAGTLRSRLARAREKLRIGLTRRGVALPAAALGAVLAPRSASASIPPLLCDSTTRAAIQFAARHAAVGGALAAPASALAQEVLQTMLLHKLRLTAVSLFLLAALATGAGWLARSLAMKDDPVKHPAAPPVGRGSHDPAQPPDRRSPEPGPARMTVAGRVLNPDGKPVPGAVVDLIARPHRPWVAASEDSGSITLLGEGQSDGDGRYRLDAPRTASSRDFEVYALAAAPGYGLGWAQLNPDAERPSAEIKLQPEQVIVVRLIDLTGRPAGGVEVRLLGLGRPRDNGERWEGIWNVEDPPKGLRAWPRPVTSDSRGKIALPGLGGGVNVQLQVRDAPFARQDLRIDAATSAAGKEISLALEPARLIEGRVLAADTGRPIPHTIVSATTRIHNEHASGFFAAKFRADDQGRFVMNPIAGEPYAVGAYPTGDEPYLVQEEKLPLTKGAVRVTHDIKVQRGVLIRGKVTEQPTGRPVPGSSIQYIPIGGTSSGGVLSGWQAIVASQDDGSFRIVVPPGKGHLLVYGPTSEYVLGEVGSNRLHSDRPGGNRIRAGAFIPYDVKAGDSPHDVVAALRRGVTIRGRVEGPDSRTVTAGFILTTLHTMAINPGWRGDLNNVPIRDGRFELHGLDPEGSTRIYLLDAEHEWGATVERLGQAGRRGPDHPARALRPGEGAVRRARRRARGQTPPVHGVRRHTRTEPVQPERSGSGRADGRRRQHPQCGPQALLEHAAQRCRGSPHHGLADPRGVVPNHRPLDAGRPEPGPANPQGFSRQTGRESRLG